MPDVQPARAQSPSITLTAPVDGLVVSLDEVPDAVFAGKMLGDGIAIDPTGSTLVAPCAGKIIQLHRANHALTLKADERTSVLLHIGLNTVNLKGEGFTPLVSEGEDVKAGQELIRFDLDLIARRAVSALTLMVVTEGGESLSIIHPTGTVKAGLDEVLQLMGETEEVAKSRTRHSTPKGDAGASNSGDVMELTSPPIVVRNAHGIHARPAARLVEVAKKWTSLVTVEFGTKVASATSVFELMNLDVEFGSEIRLRARGADAKSAIETISKAIESGLGEDLSHAGGAEAEAGQTRLVSTEKGLLGGVAASPGVAIGKVKVRSLDAPKFEKDGKGGAIEDEKLLAGIKQAAAELKTEQEAFKKAGEAEKAQIFSAHLEILEDDSLVTEAKSLTANGSSAAQAWNLAIGLRVEKMSALKSARMRERADDLRDIGQRVLYSIVGQKRPTLSLTKETILVCEDLTPSTVAALSADSIGGIITISGGGTSHAAIIARSMGVPYVAAVGEAGALLVDGLEVVLNGTTGSVRLSPSDVHLAEAKKLIGDNRLAEANAQKRSGERAKTRDGREVEVAANIGNAKDALAAVEKGCDGVGLLRSEFLFLNRRTAPTEDEQRKEYEAIGRALGHSRSLVVRTLDVGGDKPLSYLPQPEEENPFLGIRGLRLSLKHPEMFQVQLRAALSAARHTKLNLMFPMVAQVDEFERAREMTEKEMQKMGVKENVAIGVMVEVPSAALNAAWLAKRVDFFSIGTNDLTQYTLAMDRGHPELSAQADAFDPAVLRLIKMTCDAAHPAGKWVGVCGGLAAEPLAAALLIGLDIDELSVPAPVIPELKELVRSLSHAECKALADNALAMPTAQAVRKLLGAFETGAFQTGGSQSSAFQGAKQS